MTRTDASRTQRSFGARNRPEVCQELSCNPSSLRRLHTVHERLVYLLRLWPGGVKQYSTCVSFGFWPSSHAAKNVRNSRSHLDQFCAIGPPEKFILTGGVSAFIFQLMYGTISDTMSTMLFDSNTTFIANTNHNNRPSSFGSN